MFPMKFLHFASPIFKPLWVLIFPKKSGRRSPQGPFRLQVGRPATHLQVSAQCGQGHGFSLGPGVLVSPPNHGSGWVVGHGCRLTLYHINIPQWLKHIWFNTEWLDSCSWVMGYSYFFWGNGSKYWLLYWNINLSDDYSGLIWDHWISYWHVANIGTCLFSKVRWDKLGAFNNTDTKNKAYNTNMLFKRLLTSPK